MLPQTMVNSSGTTTYGWDFENRLTSVSLPGSGGTVSFKYDPFGRRIYKSSTSGTSVYAFDGDNLIEETNSAGGVVARYEQGLTIDEPLVMLRSATTSYYQADGLGSITSLTNTSGAAAETYSYDSFGNILATTGSLTNHSNTPDANSILKPPSITIAPDTTIRRWGGLQVRTRPSVWRGPPFLYLCRKQPDQFD